MVQKSSTLPKIVNSRPANGGPSQWNIEPKYFHVDRNTIALDSEHSDDDVDVNGLPPLSMYLAQYTESHYTPENPWLYSLFYLDVETSRSVMKKWYEQCTHCCSVDMLDFYGSLLLLLRQYIQFWTGVGDNHNWITCWIYSQPSSVVPFWLGGWYMCNLSRKN